MRSASLFIAIVVLSAAGCGCTSRPATSSGGATTPLALAKAAPPLRVVCLSVTQSYPQIEEPFSVPIAEAAERVLTALGLEVAAQGAVCDATLSMNLTLEALGENYTGLAGPGGFCYTGARVHAEMALAVAGQKPTTWSATREELPRTNVVLSYCPEEPIEAPFDELWPEVLVDGLAYF